MKHLSFAQSATIGFAVSLLGSVLFYVLTLVLPASYSLEIAAAVVCIAYIVMLIAKHPRKTGMLGVPAVLIMLMIVLTFLTPSALVTLSALAGFIWLARSTYYYQSIFCALADMLLTMLSFIVAASAFRYHQSVFLGFWVFFLLQSLTAFIPKKLTGTKQPLMAGTPSESANAEFNQAQQAAEAALQKLVNH
ncbi:MAG: hypothetical protein H7A01_04945 [Hahellaceae bacterium]|nr:hypothetical protein [Hahellaceae bacterium]MCP5212765.1 hypothetical protein [Hahellaceae bacterium]